MNIETLNAILEALRGASYLAAAVASLYIVVTAAVWPVIMMTLTRGLLAAIKSWRDVQVERQRTDHRVVQAQAEVKLIRDEVKSAGFISDSVALEWLRVAGKYRAKNGSSYLHHSDVSKAESKLLTDD